MITEEQRKERFNYLGSSDIAAILGLSRYATPISVWAEKTGRLPPEDISKKLPVRLGNKMEQVVAELFEEETGKKVRRVNETVYHKNHPFIACNLDRRVVGEAAVLEIKTVAAWRRGEFNGDEVPAESLVQVYHQLAVTGLPRAYLCILVGNSDLIIREIPCDEKTQADLIKKEVEFWETFVLPKVIPHWVTRYDADVLGRLYPSADETKDIVLGDDANKLIETLHALKKDCNQVEGMIAQTENELKLLLGDAQSGNTGTYQVWWVNTERCRLDVRRIKAELPQIYEQYKLIGNGRTFSYKKINNGE